MQIYLRKYATSGSIDFDLYSIDGSTILTSAAFASGCCMLMDDSGSSFSSTNLPTITQNGFKLTFTSSELTTKRLKIKLVDTNVNKTWLDTGLLIESYGTSASMHSDLSSGLLDNLIDTVAIREVLTELLAGISGKIVKNLDTYAYLARDNATTVFTMSAGQDVRLRV